MVKFFTFTSQSRSARSVLAVRIVDRGPPFEYPCPMQTAVQFQVLEVFVLCAFDRLVRSAHRAGGWWIAHVRNNRSIAQQSTDRACPVLCYRRLPWRCMLRLLLPLHSCDWLLFKHLDDKQRPFCQLMHACSYPLIR